MKQSLLELTQDILASMDSDEVNSISDTTEATQVARIIRQAYYDLIDDLNPPEHYDRFELLASGDSTQPTLMTLPADINTLQWIKYNCSTVTSPEVNYLEIRYLPTKEFIDRMYRMNPDNSNVFTYNITTVDGSTMPVYYENDKYPQYYTSINDKTVLFDSYDSALDTTLQKDKTDCYGKKAIVFNLVDSFVPDLDEPFFTRLLNEAKSLAFAELKSVDHAIASRNAKRSRNRSFARKFKVQGLSDFEQLPNFGRM